MTAAEVSAAAQITSDNWFEYAGCVVFVLFVFWLNRKAGE